jgi:HK97 family phage portal protein
MKTKTTTTKAKPRKRATKALSQTKPAEPNSTTTRIFFLPQRTAGVRVTEETALTLGAVWACVRVITESLAGLPWLVYRKRRDGGNDLQYDHQLNWLLDTQPNPETTAFTFRETLIAHALTWGNCYAEVERDAADRPVWLWQITPDRVEPVRFRGRIIYDIANPRGPNTVLERNEMFHVPGLGFDGLVGYSVIRMAARAIGVGIGLEESGSSFFANDSTPGGLLIHPEKLTPEARKNIEESWQKRHAGPNNRRRVAVLEEGLKWEATGLPPEDSQFVEQKQLTPTEIARWFRVPPHKIGDLTRSTNNNIEHQSIEFVEDTLRPWAERFESEANIRLFGRNNAGTLHTIINLDERMRGDTAARAEYYKTMSMVGALSVNEMRVQENLNPIGPDGDKRFVQLNMQLLENAGEEPPPGQEPPTEPASDELRTRIESAGLDVLRDAVRRALKREEHEARRQLKAGKPYEKWSGKFLAEHRDYMREILLPPLRLLEQCYGGAASADVSLAVYLDKHLEGFAAFAAEPVEQDPLKHADDLRRCVQAAAAVQGAA